MLGEIAFAEVARAPWPAWPVVDDDTVDAAVDALRSGRWAISGYHVGQPSRERVFAARFASALDARYCVPTTSGSSALVMALQALDVGPGDEVVIPALTWVADATAVLNVGATPVIADVDPSTLCLDPAAAAAALTQRTRAIIAVHLYGSMCNLDRLSALAASSGVALIEDCAQSHGAAWRGRVGGRYGKLGAFSFQQGKLVTCGEGGAVVTDDPVLAARLEQLRADSRRMRGDRPRPGEMELEAVGTMQGSNLCMSELHAAILTAQLPRLPEQNTRRAANAATLDRLLAGIPGVRPQGVPDAVTARALYCYAFTIEPWAFGGLDGKTFAALLASELGVADFHIHGHYPPIHRSPLFCPWTNRRYAFLDRSASDWRSLAFPCAERAHERGVVLHHSMLLAEPRRMTEIAEAIDKLAGWARKGCR
jgi:L-glutamine:2-deoxy-scyllo-inosose/3-amino-2,3-dideoxy-scyllo-inosose aminotransferase